MCVGLLPFRCALANWALEWVSRSSINVRSEFPLRKGISSKCAINSRESTRVRSGLCWCKKNGSRKLGERALVNIECVLTEAGFICIKHSNYLHTSRVQEGEPSSGSRKSLQRFRANRKLWRRRKTSKIHFAPHKSSLTKKKLRAEASSSMNFGRLPVPWLIALIVDLHTDFFPSPFFLEVFLWTHFYGRCEVRATKRLNDFLGFPLFVSTKTPRCDVNNFWGFILLERLLKHCVVTCITFQQITSETLAQPKRKLTKSPRDDFARL